MFLDEDDELKVKGGGGGVSRQGSEIITAQGGGSQVFYGFKTSVFS